MEVKKRHEPIYRFFRGLLSPLFKRLLRYYEYDVVEPTQNPTIILANHVTDFDPMLMSVSFPQQMYFVASEHILRLGLVSRIIKYLAAPIGRTKGRRDAVTVMEVFRTLKKGKNVCVFAEGNRTFTGKTCEVLASTGKMVRVSGADLVTYKLTGGYFSSPRWSRSLRKGAMTGRLIGRYTAAQLQLMSAQEVNALIEKDLYEDAYARQEEEHIAFKGKDLAENMEIALYICPKCEQVKTMKSKGNFFSCTCGYTVEYTQFGELVGENVIFNSTTDWDEWQLKKLPALIEEAGEKPICSDQNQRIYKVQPASRSQLIEEGELKIYRDRLCCGNSSFLISDISDMAIYGRMTLAFSTLDGNQYEIKSPFPRSACIYFELFQILKKG
ncbi:1-acyl-sn-glycerol-3-phosphate acyltransferase [Eubacteriales bacterium OttesenSCG-928-K08]|nr:1-acyl-sn-glycerol-3-phosphate acyltransferase [Eubacteriales bacterium OttesenSCG-928-K08]